MCQMGDVSPRIWVEGSVVFRVCNMIVCIRDIVSHENKNKHNLLISCICRTSKSNPN